MATRSQRRLIAQRDAIKSRLKDRITAAERQSLEALLARLQELIPEGA